MVIMRQVVVTRGVQQSEGQGNSSRGKKVQWAPGWVSGLTGDRLLAGKRGAFRSPTASSAGFRNHKWRIEQERKSSLPCEQRVTGLIRSSHLIIKAIGCAKWSRFLPLVFGC